ncbi:ABC transporter permease subunit [bacterium]|nr:ABC transporter permease subunit [bacterium]
MSRYLLQRLVLLIPTVFGISVAVFLLMRMLPGDVVQVMIGPEISVSEEQRAALYRLFGLDAPLHIQFFRWISSVVQGDLGVSLRTGQPVSELLGQRLLITAELTILSVLVSWLIAIPLGIVSAVRRNSIFDFISHIFGLIGLSVPNFWLATMLLLVTSLYLRWQPSPIWVSPFEDPFVNFQQMILPVFSLSVALVAVVMRMMRSSMLEVLGHDYIRTARAKGLSYVMLLNRHALKNAFIPVVTVMGIQVGYLLGGAVVIEQIFGLPGVGWMILNGIYQRDYPVVQGGVLFLALVFVLINLLVDMLYAYADPRIRYD